MSDIIELTDTTRLRVEQDLSPECPRGNWFMATGFVKIQGRGDSRRSDVPAVYDDPFRITEAWDQLAYLVQSRYTPDEALVTRYVRIFHGALVEYDSEHGGFWFVDPAWRAEHEPVELKDHDPVAWQQAVIDSEQKVYGQWADGEVYGVILERLETWSKIDGTQRDEWEEVDSLWGCYLDDDYTPQHVAQTNFSLTDEESAALGLEVPA